MPVNVVKDFCQTTDAVVECRLKVVGELQDFIGHMVTQRDVEGFCRKTYDWFQMKYGMNCPKQCHKLQCRSTCQWLENKAEIEKRREQLDKDMGANSEATAAWRDQESAVKELEGELDFAVRKEKRAQTEAKRAEAKVEEEQAELKTVATKAEGAAEEARKLEQTVEKLQG